jgi:hypothetical protein
LGQTIDGSVRYHIPSLGTVIRNWDSNSSLVSYQSDDHNLLFHFLKNKT